MTMSTLAPDFTRTRRIPRLSIEREGIVFYNVTPNRVKIELTIQNRGEDWSAPSQARLEAAPFGAFVPWAPLAVLDVPSIEPGGSVVLETYATRVVPRPLGPPDRIPPQRVLTALGAEDEPGRRNPQRLSSQEDAAPPLPFDLFDLFGQGNTHFAGNLNVFVGHKPVERHLAQALRIYPGRTNVAMFVVGSKPDAYAFHLSGHAKGWDAVLSDLTPSSIPSHSAFATARW